MSIGSEITNKINNLVEIIQNDTIITGGHFILKGNVPELNEGTIESFKSAAILYKTAKDKGLRVGLGILINDIGMTCDKNVCYVVDVIDREKFTLPSEYIQILNELNVDIKELDIYWEKHLRNKSLMEFKRRQIKVNKNIKKMDGDYWLEIENGERLLLTRGMRNSPYGLPACPLIMAGYAIEQKSRKWNSSMNIYYIDIDNYENVPNHFMVEKGVTVARDFKIGIDIKNIYFTHDKVITNF